MQKRHTDRKMYFRDLEITSKEFYISYLSDFTELTPKSRILEVGCGEGGNLVPFAQLGCKVTGIDIAECRIKDAQAYFSEISNHATFVCCDFMQYPVPCKEEDKYDVILLHDVIEHVPTKEPFFCTPKKVYENKRRAVCRIPCMANAFWRTSTDLQKQTLFTSAIHSLAAEPFIQVVAKNMQ